MYYLYHIPGKKIGITSNLNTRVTLIQGYKKGEYEVLESSEDIDYISDKEIELQKSYGYKIDRCKYNKLYLKSNTMKINATEQTSTFPTSLKHLEEDLNIHKGLKWKTSLSEFELTDKSIKWILVNARISMYNPTRSYIYNKAFYEACVNNIDTNYKETILMAKNIDIFENIRQWSNERDILKKGDIKTQLIKLYEETGELAKAILEKDREEIIDAIGDSIVVLTNLAYFAGTTIEECIDSAYKEISNRKGKMINGTFIKDEN